LKSKSAAIALIIWLTSVVLLWGLAFAPVPSSTPEWLLAAKYICFGKKPSGMPENYGWLNLAASPMIMLAAIFIIWSPGTVINTIKDAFKHKYYRLIIYLYLIIFGWLFYSAIAQARKAAAFNNIDYSFMSDPLPEDFTRTHKALPDFRLTDQSGKPVTRSDIRGPAILTFAYLHCETICPLLIQNAVTASRKYSGTNPAAIYIITLDPWRDKPGQLEQIIQKWKLPSNVRVLTSEHPESTIEILNKLEVERSRNTQTGDITHAGLVYILNPKSEITYTLINPGVMRLVDALQKAEQ